MTTITSKITLVDKKLKLRDAKSCEWYVISDLGHVANGHLGVVTLGEDFVTVYGAVYTDSTLILSKIKSIEINAEKY